MNPSDDVFTILAGHAKELMDRYSVTRLAVFGSAARGELGPASDVDILAEFEHPTFDGYMGLKFALEDVLGRSVDLVTSDALKPLIRDEVLAGARDVA